ncbi:growth/differentiation factor 9 isoform X2 [Conger conger]|uniref:growth/differentiation factor 9 isoform X2 n=1 Tax=Conger conger TaxID=82655 RepID=UPI002A59CAD4|nr:growth/differentiation factor 9 isoform X2 [Conger conger]
MENLVKIFIVLYFHGIILPLVFGDFPGTSSQGTVDGTEDTVDSTVYGTILSPLLKALSEQATWEDFAPKLIPESKYVRYMKRLYRVSSKHKRSREGTSSQLYNTVRLITPRDECLQQNKDQTSSFTSVCYLDVQEQEDDQQQQQLCPSSHYSVKFPVHTERSRRKWVEVDITAFLHPLIKSQKKGIHLLINLTCVTDGRPDSRNLGPVELAVRSPSLLLYLNDTSELAYQRWPTAARSENPMADLVTGADKSHVQHGPDERASRRRRNFPSSEATQTNLEDNPADHFLNYEFPTDDCDLYDFRVSFSQLKLDHWIIAPHKYNPRYCKGICPRALGSIYGSPVHTMVQNIIYEKLDSSVPRPSCVPSEYNPLSVLTIEKDGSIAYKEYEDMIATKCTCR